MAACDPNNIGYDPHIIAPINIGPTGCYCGNHNAVIGSPARTEITHRQYLRQRKKLKVGYNQCPTKSRIRQK